VRDRPRAERRQQLPRAKRERLHVGMFDLPRPAHLLHDQERVHAHVDLVDAAPPRLLEADDQRRVLGDVVRRRPERLRELGDDVAVAVEEDGARAGRPGIPARRSVGVQDGFHAAGAMSSANFARSTLPPDTIATTRSPRRTLILPVSRAAVAAAPAGSATSLARSARKRMPSAIVASESRTTSSTRRWQISRPRVPAIGPARPSAMVLIDVSATGLPASRAV